MSKNEVASTHTQTNTSYVTVCCLFCYTSTFTTSCQTALVAPRDRQPQSLLTSKCSIIYWDTGQTPHLGAGGRRFKWMQSCGLNLHAAAVSLFNCFFLCSISRHTQLVRTAQEHWLLFCRACVYRFFARVGDCLNFTDAPAFSFKSVEPTSWIYHRKQLDFRMTVMTL